MRAQVFLAVFLFGVLLGAFLIGLLASEPPLCRFAPAPPSVGIWQEHGDDYDI